MCKWEIHLCKDRQKVNRAYCVGVQWRTYITKEAMFRTIRGEINHAVFLRWKCSSEKVWNQKWQQQLWIMKNISSAMKIWLKLSFQSSFILRKAGRGRKVVSEPICVFHGTCLWQSIKAIACGPISDTELLFFKSWGHRTEQGLASQCVNHLFFCNWEHLGSLKLLTLSCKRCCSSFILTIESQGIF